MTFFGWPTRGGWLSLLNLAAFAAIVWAASVGAAGDWAAWPSVVLMFPLGCLAELASGRPRTASGVVWQCVLFAVNALIWGYGISWLWSEVTSLRPTRAERRTCAGHCPHCDYDLRGSLHATRCPECGGHVPIVRRESSDIGRRLRAVVDDRDRS